MPGSNLVIFYIWNRFEPLSERNLYRCSKKFSQQKLKKILKVHFARTFIFISLVMLFSPLRRRSKGLHNIDWCRFISPKNTLSTTIKLKGSSIASCMHTFSFKSMMIYIAYIWLNKNDFHWVKLWMFISPHI